MKKLLCLILALALCLSLAACGGGNKSVSSDQYPELTGKKIVQAAEYHYTLDFGCRETFNLIFLITDAYNPDMGSAGIYMLDMDSGKLYDDSFLNWDIMIQGDSWNMDTRDTALMVLFNSYDCNKDGDILWSDAETFTHYSSSQIAELSAQLSGGSDVSSGNAQQPSLPAEQVHTEVNESSAQPAIDPEFVYEQAKLLNIRLNAAAYYTFEVSEGYQETYNLLFFKSTEFDGYKVESFSAPGLYMLDLDTGIWYDSSFMDWDVMVKGNSPNMDTRETALMNIFNIFDQNLTQDAFGDDAVFLDAATLEQINQKLLIDELTRTKAAYPYGSIDEESRKLSDTELAALYNRPAGYKKSAISTVSDAIAYLDMHHPELWMGMQVSNGVDLDKFWLRSAQECLYTAEDNILSRSCVVNCLSYLLDDDYEIESLVAFWMGPNQSGEDGPQKVINCIKTANGYLFFDPVLRMQGDAISRKGALLPEMACSSVAEYLETIRTNPTLSADIKYIFKNTGGVRMDYVRRFAGGYSITTESKGIELVYFSSGAQTEEAVNLIAPENISKYKLSTMLGGVTLTAEEAKALVGAAPEVVQEKVKTAADVLMYMLAAQTGDTHGCLCTNVGEYTWHWNISAKEVMSLGLGNCGSCANLANYLLDGDYEEVGYMDQAYYPGNGGSHVYTYILHEGKYYIIDYSWFIFNNYDPALDYAPFVLNSLTEWPEKIPYVYGPVCLVMTYDTPGMQYPVIFGDSYEQQLGGMYYVLPEGVEYTVLYEAPDGYQYHHIPFDTSAYNCNVFW